MGANLSDIRVFAATESGIAIAPSGNRRRNERCEHEQRLEVDPHNDRSIRLISLWLEQATGFKGVAIAREVRDE